MNVIISVCVILFSIISTHIHASTDSSIDNFSKNVKIIIDTDDHPHFSNVKSKCSYYWSYFAGKIKKKDGSNIKKLECSRFSKEIKLSEGYAPLGVFFRSRIKKTDKSIPKYKWFIENISAGKPTIIAKYDSFNAAMVFDKTGKYKVSLQVTYDNGRKDEDSIFVTVWPRDKKTYYVDKKIGDDRFNGLSTTPNENCNANASPIGFCDGPWRTATRGFSVLAPHNWRKKSAKNYTADSICKSYVEKRIRRYPDGDYSLYRNISTPYPEALKSEKRKFIKPYSINICKKLTARIKASIRPGDQVLFKRGQIFDFETGLASIIEFNKKINGKDFKYEKLSCTSLITTKHWDKNLGILFGAYGSGVKPIIKNTGKTSCMSFNMIGVGLMHLAFQDIVFDLESANGEKHLNRASFMFSVGQALNLVFNSVVIKKFNQGILFHNAHGVFIKDSLFYDSKVVQLYSETASDVAFINNKFDYSGNHIAYTNMSNALVVRNSFSRQAFGRTALRVYGSSLKNPINSIWVSDNKFEGWIDPRTRSSCITGRCPFANGKRYNYSLVEFHPNVPNAEKFSENIVFKRNILRNTENMLRIGSVHNFTIENNTFDTADNGDTPRIILHSSWATRPLQNITINNNLFIERANNSSNKGTTINLESYSSDIDNHKRITITNNTFDNQRKRCIFRYKNAKTKKTRCLIDSGNYRLSENGDILPYLKFSNIKFKK